MAEGAWVESGTECSHRQSKHVSAGRKNLHNEASQPHAILYKHSGAPSGGPTFSNSARPMRHRHRLIWGRSEPVSSALSLASHNFPNAALVGVRDMLCLSGHLDMHLVGRGVRLSIAAPDGCALITVCVKFHKRAKRANFCGSFWSLPSAVNEMLIRVMGTADNKKGKLITVHSSFRSLLHSAPLPVLMEKLYKSLQRGDSPDIK